VAASSLRSAQHAGACARHGQGQGAGAERRRRSLRQARAVRGAQEGHGGGQGGLTA
jgi:hypothetical protein